MNKMRFCGFSLWDWAKHLDLYSNEKDRLRVKYYSTPWSWAIAHLNFGLKKKYCRGKIGHFHSVKVSWNNNTLNVYSVNWYTFV